MALITNLTKGVKERHSIHRQTDCNYYVIRDENGNQFLQLDTFGSDRRQIQGKTSQSIQFSPDAIRMLKQILLREFE